MNKTIGTIGEMASKIQFADSAAANGTNNPDSSDALMQTGSLNNSKMEEDQGTVLGGRDCRHRCDGKYDELPEWYKKSTNKYITTGWRVNFEGPCEVTKSACMCHNDSINIWSHLFGSLLTFILGLLILTNSDSQRSIAQQGWQNFLT